MSDTSLGDILSDVEPVVEVKEAAEETKELPLETTEKVVETPEKAAEEVAEVSESMVPQKALHEERAKRQALQDQMNLLMPKLVEMNGSKPKEPAKAPVSFNEDPEGFINSRFEEQQRSNTAKYLDLSEANAKGRHEDYPEVFAVFEGLARKEPVLLEKMMQQPDPAEWAYRTAKRAKDIAEMGDPAAFRERTRAELLAEIKAEQEAEAVETAPDLPNIPKTLGKTRTVGSRKGPAWAGPETLDEILK